MSSCRLLCSLATLMIMLPTSVAYNLTVNPTSGSYSISIDGKTWFESGATSYTVNGTKKSSSDSSLKLLKAEHGEGADEMGKFKLTSLTWGEGEFVTNFREYAQSIVFEQVFPMGLEGTTSNPEHPMDVRDDVSSAFPSFSTSSKEAMANSDQLGYLAFASDMTGSGFVYGTDLSKKDVPTGVKGFGPTCFYSKDMSNTMILSSHSQFMAASNSYQGSDLAYGVQGSITAYPKGYTVSFILSESSSGSVNQAFEEWGDKLLKLYGKSREMTYRDLSLNYLGYSTDNGAYYYYQTEGHASGERGPPYTPGKTYQETLIDVKKYADQVGIPYRYVLLDSWWYYQGVGSGVSNWIGRPDVFPDGNAYLRNATGWPIMGHNRYWAIDNVYATQNGGQYDFIVEKKSDNKKYKDFSWPTEQRFWDDLMYNSSQWGLFMYEQDWLDTEYDNVYHLNVNATAARTWLLQMGSAAARNDLTIQYCMSHCRHIMQSLEIPAVTNARASGDYHPGGDQWQPIGTTGIFAWSVAIGPTKDNFWSMPGVQSGSSYKDYATVQEPYNRLQSAVSTLSKGPVAPSDKIGSSDVELILKSIMKDGRLLQGDKPAMTIDAMHQEKAFNGEHKNGEIWATSTTISDMKWSVLLSATLEKDWDLPLNALSLKGDYVSYEANSTSDIHTAESIPLKGHKSKSDFQVWASAPVLPNGWALLGEPTKWVPVSGARFKDVTYTAGTSGDTTSTQLVGTPGEEIEVVWFYKMKTITVACTFPTSGSLHMTVTKAGGKCI